MSDGTRVIARADIGWVVYRVKTNSSVYHLAIHPGDGEYRRRCAKLRGVSSTLGSSLDVQDSAPLIGGRLLFDVPVKEWPGNVLEVGTARTSPVVSVERESDAEIVTAITSGIVPAGSNQTDRGIEVTTYSKHSKTIHEPVKPQYPEDYVEALESAASWLRHVYRKGDLVDDLQEHRDLLERFRVSYADCAILMTGIRGKLDRTR